MDRRTAAHSDRGLLLDRKSASARRGSFEARSVPYRLLRNKKAEWEEYRSEVTAFELRKNLPVL
ncbi:glutamine synthetase [Streptomyces sp. NPDC051997]|uniref:glutamine synthetase n=1 Tax=Streptomyces sp. NPDC051997 TaxID=3155611 RepID=UPI003442D659